MDGALLKTHRQLHSMVRTATGNCVLPKPDYLSPINLIS